MCAIKKKVVSEEELSVYTTTGVVSGEEVMKAIHDFYELGPVTRNALWDFSQGELRDLSSDDVKQIAQVPRKSLELRDGGKTAIVAPDDLAFGMGRMYQGSTESEVLPFKIKVFRDLETAKKWLSE